jgi:flagellar basal-body rod modification protein FlgD
MSVTAVGTGTANTAGNPGLAGNRTIANNFDQFLLLLTAQLQNQNPLDPLDTNQFTQQLVQFAQVEQQINMNSALNQLITLQQNTQTTQAISLVGATVTVDGATARLANGAAAWSFSPDKTGTATLTVKDSSGQVVYSADRTVSPGDQTFVWDGKNNSGTRMPDGKYTLSVSLKDTSGTSTALSVEHTGVVEGVDLTKSPPTLTIDGLEYTLDQIKEVRRPPAVETAANPPTPSTP